MAIRVCDKGRNVRRQFLLPLGELNEFRRQATRDVLAASAVYEMGRNGGYPAHVDPDCDEVAPALPIAASGLTNSERSKRAVGLSGPEPRLFLSRREPVRNASN